MILVFEINDSNIHMLITLINSNIIVLLQIVMLESKI